MNFVKIGKHEWCTEDARFTQVQNGDLIPIAKSITEWESYCLNDEYCCCAYDFDDKNINNYINFYTMLHYIEAFYIYVLLLNSLLQHSLIL